MGFLLFVIIIVFAIAGMKKKDPKSFEELKKAFTPEKSSSAGRIRPQSSTLPRMTGAPEQSPDPEFVPKRISHSKGEAVKLSFEFEDRRNDWLAKQLREENRILRSGDLLDLGALHSKSCAADELKSAHVHDDTIDTGE